MKKVRMMITVILLTFCFILPVLAVNYSQSDSYFTVYYHDYPSSLEAESSGSVKSGPAIMACVGVEGGGAECGDPGSSSYSKLSFGAAGYNNHRHFLRDEAGNQYFYR